MDPSGNFAMITGASSGLGWYISKALGERGYNIIAISNQSGKLKELKNELERDFEISVITLDLDLATEKAAYLVFEYCENHRIPVEVLVNNAGSLVYGETVRIDPARIRSALALHMITPALLCRLFGEKMIKTGKGYILNVSSISSVMPYPTISIYGPTKTFLRYFTRAIRTEMRPHGIRVSCLMPGAVDTSLYENTGFDIVRGRKLGLVKKPEKVADAGIRALFRDRPECVPGLLNKMAVWFLPILPGFLVRLVYTRNRNPLETAEKIPEQVHFTEAQY